MPCFLSCHCVKLHCGPRTRPITHVTRLAVAEYARGLPGEALGERALPIVSLLCHLGKSTRISGARHPPMAATWGLPDAAATAAYISALLGRRNTPSWPAIAGLLGVQGAWLCTVWAGVLRQA